MKKVYKLIASYLAIILLLGSITTVPTFAEPTTSFYAEDVSAQAGDTITVSIFVNRSVGFVSATLNVTYDTSVLTLVGAKDTGLIDGAKHTTNFVSPYVLSWENDLKTSNYSVSGALIELTFSVSSFAEPGEYSIKIDAPLHGVLDCNGEEVDCTFTSGTITVVAAECEHDWSTWKKSSASKHKHTCNLCGEVEYESHSFDEGVITEEPSHGIDGEIKYTCEDCGYADYDILDAEEHDFGEWEPYDDEQHKRICACGEDDSVEYEDHSWDDGVVATNGETTYTCEDCGATKVVAPEPEPVPVTGIALSLTSVTLEVGEYKSIIATVLPEDATNPSVKWDSSDLSVVSIGVGVEDSTFGVLQAHKAGTVTITATTEDGAYVATCVVIVNAPAPEFIPGDINGDGVLNNKDVTRLMQYHAGWDVEVNELALDVNGDGSYNNKDVTRLMQYIAGWDVEIH